MNQIQIPATIEEAVTSLNGIGALLTAKAWERAAIVWAFTYEPGTKHGSNVDNKLRPAAFADFGVHGLTSPHAVYRHRRAWQQAIDEGWGGPVAPGETVALPTEDYPAYEPPGPTVQFKGFEAGDTETQVAAIKRAMEREPETAKRIEDVVVQRSGTDHALAGRVFRTYAEHNVTPKPRQDRPMLLTSMGFGSIVYSRVKDQTPRLQTYLEALAAVAVDAEIAEGVREDIDELDKTKALIEQFADKLRTAIGVDADSIFDRLVR